MSLEKGFRAYEENQVASHARTVLVAMLASAAPAMADDWWGNCDWYWSPWWGWFAACDSAPWWDSDELTWHDVGYDGDDTLNWNDID